MARDRASRPEAKPLRLFAAVEIPQDIRGALAEAVLPVRERFPKARWVPIQNQHVTVKFLGSTYPRLVEWVTGSISTVAGRHGPGSTTATGGSNAWRRPSTRPSRASSPRRSAPSPRT